MSDLRISALSEILTPHDNDVLAVDKGTSSTTADYTFKFKLASLFTMIANRAMTMINKTFTYPVIDGGMTVNFTGRVSGLNADCVDGCHVGANVSNIPIMGNGAVNGVLDLGWLGKAQAAHYNFATGYSSRTITHGSGTLNLTVSDMGYVKVAAAANCTINLPVLGANDGGISVLITHVSGAFNVAVNAGAGSALCVVKSDFTLIKKASAALNGLLTSIKLEFDGAGQWMVVGGGGFTGFES